MTTIPKDPRAEEAIRRWDELKSARSHHERDWEELARLIRPQRGGFVGADPARYRDEKPLSSDPIIAQEYFSAGLYGTLTNPANRWMGVEVDDPDLAAWQPVKEWQDLVSWRILKSFSPAVSTFYDTTVQLFGDLATFGNGFNYDEVRESERRILDMTISLAEVVYEIDAFGRVVEIVRRFRLKARQAVDMFGADALPEKLRDQAEKGGADLFTFFHHIHPNMDWRRGVLGPRGKRWTSLYACEEGACVVRENGYAEMPGYAARWEVDTGQTYGRGPGMTALPSTRVLNLIEAANLKAGQRAADPTLLAPDQRAWQLDGVVRPGEVVYGGVDFQGRRLVQPLENYGGTGLTMEMAQQKVDSIKDAFHWTLMQMAGRTGMTATEILERQEEKLRLMAPHMGRVQGEFLAPKIARRFALLWRARQLPPPPPDAAREGVGLQVTYLSAAAMAQKSMEGAAVTRFISTLAPLAEMKPRIMDRIDEDALVEMMQEANGVPARLVRSREAADQLSEQRAQQEQAAMAMQAAQAGGGVVRDLASAAAAGGRAAA